MADDAPALLTAITKRLTQAQHKPGTSSLEMNGWLRLIQRELDQALPDSKMPGKTGLETLAICKNSIEAHYGDIYLASKVGEGAE
ncbi:MAG: hypothetical protein HC938_06150 [Nitrospira sp.]|nr:hypothetical protein [Nitrospira sp.]